MRFEATLPDPRGKVLVELAEELHISRSQLMDEALSIFIKAVMEVRKGKRLMAVDPDDLKTSCELSSPTLAHVEWASQMQPLELSRGEMETLAEVLSKPAAEPNESLKRALKSRGKGK